ncbi:MAG TPA: RbsD/FucU family protein [Spirochaetia bacterium]
MLRSQLLHPEILSALAEAGHGARVLIADGNYPFSTGAFAGARRVYLNLKPGLASVTDVLETLLTAIPVESAMVMVPAQGPAPDIHATMRGMLPKGTEWVTRDRFAFYEEARSKDMALVIATGEQRVFANILLVIGVVQPK